MRVMIMRKTFFAVLVLMALTACKNVKETAEIIDLPRAETPDKNAVIAITSDNADLQGELNLVWERILPVL